MEKQLKGKEKEATETFQKDWTKCVYLIPEITLIFRTSWVTGLPDISWPATAGPVTVDVLPKSG